MTLPPLAGTVMNINKSTESRISLGTNTVKEMLGLCYMIRKQY